jgi:hypothetical protein
MTINAPLTRKELIHLVDRKYRMNQYSCGCEAYYIKIDDDWGFKFFDHEGRRNYLYRKHQQAERLDIGPKVGPKRAINVLRAKRYGFFIEHVKVGTEVYRNVPCYYKIPEVEQLVRKMESHKFPWDDFHKANLGLRKDGVLVRIDFGDCGWGGGCG